MCYERGSGVLVLLSGLVVLTTGHNHWALGRWALGMVGKDSHNCQTDVWEIEVTGRTPVTPPYVPPSPRVVTFLHIGDSLRFGDT